MSAFIGVWIPFRGTLGAIALLVAAGGYLGGLIVPTHRRLIYAIATVAAVVALVLSRGVLSWLLAIVLIATNVALVLSGRGNGTPESGDSSMTGPGA